VARSHNPHRQLLSSGRPDASDSSGPERQRLRPPSATSAAPVRINDSPPALRSCVRPRYSCPPPTTIRADRSCCTRGERRRFRDRQRSIGPNDQSTAAGSRAILAGGSLLPGRIPPWYSVRFTAVCASDRSGRLPIRVRGAVGPTPDGASRRPRAAPASAAAARQNRLHTAASARFGVIPRRSGR